MGDPEVIEALRSEFRAETEAIRAELQAVRVELQSLRTRTVDKRSRSTPAYAPQTLTQRILSAVRDRALETAELLGKLDTSPEKLKDALAELVGAGSIVNIGTEVHPQCFVRVGDETPMADLIAAVRYLITERPHTKAELEAFTGARSTRVHGAIVELKDRKGLPVVNVGSGKFAKWYIMPNVRPSGTRRRKRGESD